MRSAPNTRDKIKDAGVVVSTNPVTFLTNRFPRLISFPTSTIFVSGTSDITTISKYRSVNPIREMFWLVVWFFFYVWKKKEMATRSQWAKIVFFLLLSSTQWIIVSFKEWVYPVTITLTRFHLYLFFERYGRCVLLHHWNVKLKTL